MPACSGSAINEGGKGKNSVRDVTLGPTLVDILKEHIEAERSQRGFRLENSLGMPLDLDALARDVIRPIFQAAGLEWKGYYRGRRGAETQMNRYTHGNSQITSHHFGHTKAVALNRSPKRRRLRPSHSTRRFGRLSGDWQHRQDRV